MCVMYICRTGVPSQEVLEKSAEDNKDGVGVAWPNVNGLVSWKKGMDLKEAMALIDGMPFPFIIHFRKASSGFITPELCHPFTIDATASIALEGEAEEVLFQNGTWKEWTYDLRMATYGLGGRVKLPADDDAWMDARALAFLVHHYGTGILTALCENNPMRVAILKGDGTVEKWGRWIYPDKDPGYIQSKELSKTVSFFPSRGGTGTNSPSVSSPNANTGYWDPAVGEWVSEDEWWKRKAVADEKRARENAAVSQAAPGDNIITRADMLRILIELHWGKR